MDPQVVLCKQTHDMNFDFDVTLGTRYHSGSQKIRVMSEQWVGDNIYCPRCGNPRLEKKNNNQPVADFQCDGCGAIFELKSKKGHIGKKVADGAYDTMIERITSEQNPDLFVLSYSECLSVTTLFVIPKFLFVPSIIEKRKPLGENARRAGWMGCNILIQAIPEQGKIGIIRNQTVLDVRDVVRMYKQIEKLQTYGMEKRGWLFDVLSCVNEIASADFTLQQVYASAEILQRKHINNYHIEAKIRQQLQILRDKGFIEFIERGRYRKLNP